MVVDLAFARAHAESVILGDVCTITRPVDPRSFDFDSETGLLDEEATPTVIVALACSARETESLERSSTIGGAPKGSKMFSVKLPADYDDVEVGDVITFTTSSDPRLLNVPQLVTNVHDASLRVLRRVQTRVQEDRLGLHPG